MSVALYRKYRSATFADLIGQDHVAITLRNEVRRGEVAHAYLFAGIRGTGKTSTARILARAVTCLDVQDGEPCNRCDACVEVLGGGAVDVLEIDAASNRGIDEMRELREKVKFLPASLRRKVYIVDEAHMLTTEAWNAFLKTLEEPPPHVLFILATTEPHKVPETVRSRVQRFDFRRVGRADVAAHLARIAVREEVPADPEALDLLARSGQGSVRDAISLFDQAIAAGERPLGVEAVRRALGLADPAAVREMLRAVCRGDAGGALRAAAVAFDAGADARQLLREASRLARSAELVAVGYADGAEMGADEEAVCRELSRARSGLWVEALERFAEAEINLRQPVDARIQVELCLLRLSGTAAATGREPGQPALTAAPSAPVPGGSGTDGGPPAAGPVGPPSQPHPASVQPPPAPDDPAGTVADVGSDLSPATGPIAAAPPAAGEAPPAPPADFSNSAGAPPQTLEDWLTCWSTVVEAVNRRDPMLAGVLRSCRPVEGGPSRLVIGAPYGFHLERLQDVQKAPLLDEAVADVAGPGCAVEAVFSGAEARSTPAAGPDDLDPTRAALAAFPGSRITGSRLRDTGIDSSL